RPVPAPGLERHPRHPRRGPPPVLQHAGPPQIPARPGRRDGPRHRGVPPPGPGAASPPPDAPPPRQARLLGARLRPPARPAGALLDRVAVFFGPEVRDQLHPVDAERGPVALHGYVAAPDGERGSAGLQYWFVNGRWVRDRALAQALHEAYRGLLRAGRHPVAFL